MCKHNFVITEWIDTVVDNWNGAYTILKTSGRRAVRATCLLCGEEKNL